MHRQMCMLYLCRLFPRRNNADSNSGENGSAVENTCRDRGVREDATVLRRRLLVP